MPYDITIDTNEVTGVTTIATGFESGVGATTYTFREKKNPNVGFSVTTSTDLSDIVQFVSSEVLGIILKKGIQYEVQVTIDGEGSSDWTTFSAKTAYLGTYNFSSLAGIETTETSSGVTISVPSDPEITVPGRKNGPVTVTNRHTGIGATSVRNTNAGATVISRQPYYVTARGIQIINPKLQWSPASSSVDNSTEIDWGTPVSYWGGRLEFDVTPSQVNLGSGIDDKFKGTILSTGYDAMAVEFVNNKLCIDFNTSGVAGTQTIGTWQIQSGMDIVSPKTGYKVTPPESGSSAAYSFPETGFINDVLILDRVGGTTFLSITFTHTLASSPGAEAEIGFEARVEGGTEWLPMTGFAWDYDVTTITCEVEADCLNGDWRISNAFDPLTIEFYDNVRLNKGQFGSIATEGG